MSRELEKVLLLNDFVGKPIVFEENPAVILSWIGVQRALIRFDSGAERYVPADLAFAACLASQKTKGGDFDKSIKSLV